MKALLTSPSGAWGVPPLTSSSYLLLLAPYFLLVELKNKMPFLKIMFEIILAFISD